jgi:hypothetical protein
VFSPVELPIIFDWFSSLMVVVLDGIFGVAFLGHGQVE